MSSLWTNSAHFRWHSGCEKQSVDSRQSSVDSHQSSVVPMKRVEAVFVSFLFAALGLGGVLYGSRGWLPELASRHGAGIDAMLRYLLVTVGGLFLTGYLALAY